MNFPDLDEVLQDLADGPSNAVSVRATVAHRLDIRRRRRRTAALISAAAAVVLIVGGIGLAAKTRTSSPSVGTPPDWRYDNPVVIPAGSQLIPYRDPPLISPVTVTAGGPPTGYTANRIVDVRALFVDWPDAPYNSPNYHGPIGYQIDDSATFGYRLGTLAGEKLTTPQQVSTEQDVINGHPVQFNRTPSNTEQWGYYIGNGSKMWFTWRLTDGSYIHVWETADDKPRLIALATGILEKLSKFDTSISLGVTLSGFTARYASQQPLVQSTPHSVDESITLCPSGTPSVLTLLRAEKRTCLSAGVAAPDPDVKRPPGEIVQIDGRPVHVVAAQHLAWTDLGRGYQADAQGPPTMSITDLAIAAASIRLDPHVPTAPPQPGNQTYSASTAAPASGPLADLPTVSTPPTGSK